MQTTNNEALKPVRITKLHIGDRFVWKMKEYYSILDVDAYARKCRDTPQYISKDYGYIARVSQLYPCFDSSDSLYESRYYRTYYLCDDKEQYDRAIKLDKIINTDTREVNPELLPVLYYPGVGNDMYFITPEDKTPEAYRIYIRQ